MAGDRRDPISQLLGDTSAALIEAEALLTAVRDLHRMGSSNDDAVCSECYDDLSWPCDTILAATPSAGHIALHNQAAEHVAARRLIVARRSDVRKRLHAAAGMTVDTVTDVEDVFAVIGKRVKVGDTIQYMSPRQSGYQVIS